ncbi:MAG: hypothetical protein E7515_01975 [Ruminococcaceae bacterium]|nr:hypothetical protein [Oscillospiraceae bacterium]
MKRFLGILFLTIVLAFTVVSLTTVSSADDTDILGDAEIIEEQPITDGWLTVDEDKYYYRDGEQVKKELVTIDGKKYYFGSDGKMYKKRLISVNSKKYYLGSDGAAYTSRLISLSGKKYYLGSDGIAYKSRLASINGKKYYFGSDGVAYKSRLISVNNKKYYIGSDCTAYKSKFASLSGTKYYFGSDCIMRTGWRNIKDENGVSHKYYFGTDGVMRKGWQKIKLASGKTYSYYFKSNGNMVTGFLTLGEKTYYFKQSGRYYGGWTTANQVFSVSEIKKACKDNSFKADTNSYLALIKINIKYSEKLSESSKKGTLLILMEGAGRTSDISVRKNALGVLVRNRKIIYTNINCSTIPDCPFDPARNYDTPMPTIKSGIYGFHTIYHSSATTQCAGLKVEGANVVRHRNQTDYYSSTSTSINIHRRNRDYVAKNANEQISSAGCLLIGNSGKKSTDDYATYSAILGITEPGDSGTASYSHEVSGKVIVDRTFAKSYLRAIGYTEGAIKLIG